MDSDDMLDRETDDGAVPDDLEIEEYTAQAFDEIQDELAEQLGKSGFYDFDYSFEIHNSCWTRKNSHWCSTSYYEHHTLYVYTSQEEGASFPGEQYDVEGIAADDGVAFRERLVKAMQADAVLDSEASVARKGSADDRHYRALLVKEDE
ncbi:MAG: hypothetical protein SVU32_07480 [Candidatus Nanohaloarchaea archaeon]|nr:hypothetical protein [Candidatus Nanohaloarchaea archaeon]